MGAPLNQLPFQYVLRGPVITAMRNDTMRGQLADDHDKELEDYLGRLHDYVTSLEARIAVLEGRP